MTHTQRTLWMLGFCFAGLTAQAQTMQAVKNGSQIDVLVDGKLFTSYRFPADEKYPFFFPVNGPSGLPVTSMRNKEYPHHSSLFFACDLVNGGNYWQEGLDRGRIVSEGVKIEKASGDVVVLTDACRWTRPGAPSPFRDVRRIVLSAPSKDLRQIDFDITLEALEDVEIKKTNHSLFSARMHPALSVRGGGVLVNAEGQRGEKETFGKASPWMAGSGRHASGAVEGLAILQHPSNPWYPAPWFTRDYGFFSPTPMFWPANGVSTRLAKGEKLRLRYRVLVFSGDHVKADVGAQFAAYAQPTALRLITLDPGHFHAALVQKQMYPQIMPEVVVYAPKGPDVALHLKRIEGYNTRAEKPTAWKSKVYTGDDFLARWMSNVNAGDDFTERLLPKQSEPGAGAIMVLAGNNAKKTQYILDSIRSGFHVLADKPMAITPADFEQLKKAFQWAAQKKLLLYDIMTERYEITSQLQRHFAHSPDLFGGFDPGTPEDPSVTKESVHYFYKEVSGSPLQRPPWFYDVTQEGEGIVDVTTHLVDLVQWALFPEQVILDQDVAVLNAKTWTTAISKEQFARSTAVAEFPDYLKKYQDASGALQVACNGAFTYTLRGIHTRVSVIWDYEAPPGGKDTHFSLMRGKKLSAIIRQGAEQNYRPTLYLEPRPGLDPASLEAPLQNALAEANKLWPGVTVKRLASGWEVVVPPAYHVGHEAHFGQVMEKYLSYLEAGALPDWEVPNMIQKYRTIMEAYKKSR